jgi:hypothetical protein
MPLSEQDGKRLIAILHKETGKSIIGRRKTVEYIKNYFNVIPEDIRRTYTVQDLYDFLCDCWDYGTFKQW